MDFKRKRRRRKKEALTQKWMTTYADMITLVLVFFILLFSMSQIDVEKFKAVADSYRDRVIFDFNSSIVPTDQPSEYGEDNDNQQNLNELPERTNEEKDQQMESQNQETAPSLEDLLQEVQQFLTNEGLNDVITANRTEQGVVLVLQEKVLFESGEAEIIDEGKPFLNKVGKLLNNIPNDVKVEGHTDSRPISTYRYPSNWELSGARASSVIRYFMTVEALSPNRFQASGYADTRPIAENNSEENWQKNRRVEIIILETDH
ncbi:flagellar motor protein MotS [Salinibacillus xinjiangensis]|uniref:Flagellar motor protein MotB n=1 Tax=Salinibacillus xinjiangensis TaxID=1229268 RepID=A0A6G1X9Z2_9BACI|nr:flagellar motor protein MotS [Salinibacillus xinjiangensis]MRG87725.1 flagellar motor protein MotB [Salinibacillus xinjiangensis]